MNIQEIPINRIKILENIRTKVSKIDDIMQDIKQNGLFNPIMVMPTNDGDYILIQGYRRMTAFKKLGYETIPATFREKLELADLLILNTSENIQRQDISPMELGRICFRLKEIGLTPSEIAVRLSMPNSRIKGAMDTFQGLPSKHRDKVVYLMNSGSAKNGNIPASVANKIITLKKTYKISEAGVDRLLNMAKMEEYTISDLHIIHLLLEYGASLVEAIKEVQNYKVNRTDIIINIQEVDSLMEKYGIRNYQEFIKAIVYGELPTLKRVYFEKKPVNKVNG